MSALKPEKKKYNEIDGILLLDKPIHFTSNAALQKIKALFQAKKAGHTGSLDPLATGMLPLCFGEATKFSQFLLEADKHYFVVAKLGVSTTTGDAEGAVTAEKNVPGYSRQQILDVLRKFEGEIQQVPSMYSALKHQGKPLYKLARQGLEVQRDARTITVYQLDLIDQNENTLSLDVRCSKGTYIRTLVEDIGAMLGCGGHVIYLRRMSVSPYLENKMVTLQDLQAASTLDLGKYLLPADSALSHLPALTLTTSAAFYLKRGQSVLVSKSPKSGLIRLYTDDGDFLGVGEMQADGKVAPKRLVRIESVIDMR